MNQDNDAFLRLHGVGEIPSEYAASVLHRISDAYCGLWMLWYFVEDNKKDNNLYPKYPSIPNSISNNEAREIYGLEFDLAHSVWKWWDETTKLELKSVVLQSPGFWEFAGKLLPFETLRAYLNDRHERCKDNSYRNRLEEERMSIENGIKKMELVSSFIETAKRVGISEREISNIIRDNAVIPLLRLEALQDEEIISTAEVAHKRTDKVSENVES